MITNLCTLFDSHYLDKGLVIYDSIKMVSYNFHLYILAMDDKCYEVLQDLALPYVTPVKLQDFETEEILKAKSTRSKGEYCWMCMPPFIKYLLKNFNLDYCTEIDADMLFYQDPQILIDELIDSGCSVQFVEHRFAKNDKREWFVGKYCTQLNTIKNDEIGNVFLDEWIEKCYESTAAIKDGIHWGEQKYLDPLVEKYKKHVHSLENLGGGVAPWNLKQYRYVNTINNKIFLEEKKSGKVFSLVFYHFEGLYYFDKNSALVPLYLETDNSGFIKSLYTDYLLLIKNAKKLLEKKYSISFYIKGHPNLSSAFQGKWKNLKRLKYYVLHPASVLSRIKEKRNNTLHF